MSKITTARELAEKCKMAATQYRTIYVLGCIGAPMTRASKDRWRKAYAYNRRADRVKVIEAADENTFGFDCVCLIKSLLWGWSGDRSKVYGGAVYVSNGVPDIDAGAMSARCKDASSDFDNIQIGEAVWMPGHIGVYVGDGLAVECTPKWAGGVQLTACNCDRAGYPRRNWAKHGKLPYVTYEAPPAANTGAALPKLRRGSKGASVKAMQILLIGYGFGCGVCGADGDFGTGTEAAVRKYQAARGLTADGVCGPLTWRALLGSN